MPVLGSTSPTGGGGAVGLESVGPVDGMADDGMAVVGMGDEVAVGFVVGLVGGLVGGLVVVGFGAAGVGVAAVHDVTDPDLPHLQVWTVAPFPARRVAVSPVLFQM